MKRIFGAGRIRARGFGFMALLKRSRFRTPGYVVAGVKIVDHQGGMPSIPKMILRAFMILIRPIEFWVDFLWLTSEPTRQTLRDKYVGTYVVRTDAVPIANGRIEHVTLFVMGCSLCYQEVRGGGKAATQTSP